MNPSQKRITAAVIGASGYTGLELLKLLVRHPYLDPVVLVSESSVGVKLSDYAPYFQGKCEKTFEAFNAKRCVEACDVVFFATPHGVSMRYAKMFYDSALRIVDLSGDYRLGLADYEHYYGRAHEDAESLNLWVYGLCEVFAEKIRNASYVANPGCYATSVLLALLPLCQKYTPAHIICDVKSGVSGRGKKLSEDALFIECNENLLAYKLENHQHIPEIELTLERYTGHRPSLIFTPHLIPMNRGILSSIYVLFDTMPDISTEDLRILYQQFYHTQSHIKLLESGAVPQTKDVIHTNNCHLVLHVNRQKKLIKIIAVLDNLIKGAAGTAIQNCNLMYDLQVPHIFN